MVVHYIRNTFSLDVRVLRIESAFDLVYFWLTDFLLIVFVLLVFSNLVSVFFVDHKAYLLTNLFSTIESW